MLEFLPLCLIYYIVSFLNATNTLALRIVCKKLSKIPINNFRLGIYGLLTPGIYDHVTYRGSNPLYDLKNCTIRKLWLTNPGYPLSPSTKVSVLIVHMEFWSIYSHPKMISYNFHGAIRHTNYSKPRHTNYGLVSNYH